MRTRSLLKLACVGLLLAGCADDEAGPSRPERRSDPHVPRAGAEQCGRLVRHRRLRVRRRLRRVARRAFMGNPYMQIIWAMANQNPTDLRTVCERMVATDPEGLQRMSDEKAALDAAPEATAPLPRRGRDVVPPPTMPIDPRRPCPMRRRPCRRGRCARRDRCSARRASATPHSVVVRSTASS